MSLTPESDRLQIGAEEITYEELARWITTYHTVVEELIENVPEGGKAASG